MRFTINFAPTLYSVFAPLSKIETRRASGFLSPRTEHLGPFNWNFENRVPALITFVPGLAIQFQNDFVDMRDGSFESLQILLDVNPRETRFSRVD